MTAVTVRTMDPDHDSDAACGIVTEAFPYLLQSPASVRHRALNSLPAERRLGLVALVDDRVAGVGAAMLSVESSVPGSAAMQITVKADARGQGCGRALFDRLLQHCHDIGATQLTSRAASAEADAFLRRREYRPSRVERISHLRLAEIPDPPPAPEGVSFVSLRELGDLRPLYEIDSAVLVDIPSDEPWQPLEFDAWKQQHATDPRIDFDSTILAFAEEKAIALAWLERVGTRVWSALSGTDPRWRGRGLAKLVKVAALRRARDAGARDAYTDNDAENAGMLAVNTWLGYQPHVEQHTYTRRL